MKVMCWMLALSAATIWSCGFTAAQEEAPAPANTAAEAETPALDDAQAKAFAAELKARLDQPPEKLMLLARQLQAQIEASLEFDRYIAELETNERILAQHRRELLQRQTQLDKQQQTLREELKAQLKKLTEIYSEQPRQLEEMKASLIEHLRPVIESLPAECTRCAEQLKRLDEQLTQVRSLRLAAQQRRTLRQQGRADIAQLATLPPLLPLTVPAAPTAAKRPRAIAPASKTPAASTSQSVAELLKALKISSCGE